MKRGKEIPPLSELEVTAEGLVPRIGAAATVLYILALAGILLISSYVIVICLG